jgi:hypothetical protein
MGTELATLLSLLVVPAAAGASWAGVRAGLNGCRKSLESIERIVARLDERVDTHAERIATLEAETAHLKDRE